jgi:hypothetical protein
MQTSKLSDVFRLLILGCLTLLAVWVITANRQPTRENRPLDAANVPQQYADAPMPEPTGEPSPIETPTIPANTPTPTVVPMGTAVRVNPDSISQIVLGLTTGLTEKSNVNANEPIGSLMWAPTGDKLLYVTNSGDLYWSALDGSNATFLHHYKYFAGSFDQRPMGNTILLTHREEQPTEGHMDVIHFASGLPPTLDEVNSVGPIFQIHWWASDRASGITHESYVGGDKLVTLDSNGTLVQQRYIPYMQSGAVQPGGARLAYITRESVTDVQFLDADPETAYILDLNTNQRIQISEPGKAWDIHSWSPDGNWILMDAFEDGCLAGVLVSADGREKVVINLTCGHGVPDAMWSPDSRRLAFSLIQGGCDAESSPCPPITSKVYIVDIPQRKLKDIDEEGSRPNSEIFMMKPSWSPDGSLLSLLTFDPECSNGSCSGLTPAFYLMSLH